MSLVIEVPDVMVKDKCMFNPRNQSIHETHSFLSLCELPPTPLCKVCVIYKKSKFGLREFSL
jgi:hypothetical protein